MQLSLVLSQRFWPGVGDKDDCWALEVLQCQLAVAPWERLPSVTEVRAAAGDPDDGHRDGGTPAEIVRAATTLWPYLEGRLTVLRGAAYDELRALVQAGRPVTVAVLADRLPPRLANGVAVPHQVTLAARPSGQLAMANPWAGAADRWEDCAWEEIREAVMAYGQAKAGTRGVWAVAWPTEIELAGHNPAIAPQLAELGALFGALEDVGGQISATAAAAVAILADR